MEENQTIIDGVSQLLTQAGFEPAPDAEKITRFEREYADGQGKKFAVLLAQNENGLFVSFHFADRPLLKWTSVTSVQQAKAILEEHHLRL